MLLHSKLKKFQKLKKKKKLRFYPFFNHLSFILNRLKFRLSYYKTYFFFSSKKLKVYHNKNFFFNFFSLKSFISKKQKELKNLVHINNNKIVVLRKLKKKKKKILLRKKIFLKYNKYNLHLSKKFIFYNFYNKILSTIFRVGKKSKWHNTLTNLFELLSFYLKYSIPVLLLKIFIRLFTRVELRKIKSRKRITLIPFFIKPKRSIFLALKWIFTCSLKSLSITSFQNKLYVELVQLLTFKTCHSLQKLEDNNLNSFKNRAHVHYRWQKAR